DRVPRLFPTSYTVSPFRCRPTSMPELDPLSLHDALPIAGKEVVIDVRGVVWERDGRRILDHVDWTVRQGEHWALLGRNGSGKTTDRKSTRLNSSHVKNSYAVFSLKTKSNTVSVKRDRMTT